MYNCNGKLIETSKYEVVEDVDGWKLKNYQFKRKTRSIRWIPKMKKMGNIYENPDLLKETCSEAGLIAALPATE